MAKLTAKARKALPDSDFAGPGRSFPVQDKGHVKAALARAAEFHPDVIPKIKAKAKKKFPGMKFKMDGGRVAPRMDRPRRTK